MDVEARKGGTGRTTIDTAAATEIVIRQAVAESTTTEVVAAEQLLHEMSVVMTTRECVAGSNIAAHIPASTAIEVDIAIDITTTIIIGSAEVTMIDIESPEEDTETTAITVHVDEAPPEMALIVADAEATIAAREIAGITTEFMEGIRRTGQTGGIGITGGGTA